ncbi:MAG: hypothetical protein ACP5QE_07390 [Conexivisphaera sp.]
MSSLSSEEKRRFLRALKEDEEFRYTVAGYLGLSEILERLDRHEEAIRKLWEEVKALREGQEKLWEEVKALREGQEKLWENYEKLARDMHDVKVTLSRLTVSEEDESREVISYRLRNELGVEVELSSVSVDDREIDIYGASGDLCVVGEATVRLGRGLVEELDGKVELLRRARPDLLRPRLVKVIYALAATQEALEEARRRGIWVLKIDRDLVPRPNEQTR